eukprot:6187318-Pleurochrysis_carterae.AAC.4
MVGLLRPASTDVRRSRASNEETRDHRKRSGASALRASPREVVAACARCFCECAPAASASARAPSSTPSSSASASCSSCASSSPATEASSTRLSPSMRRPALERPWRRALRSRGRRATGWSESYATRSACTEVTW